MTGEISRHQSGWLPRHMGQRALVYLDWDGWDWRGTDLGYDVGRMGYETDGTDETDGNGSDATDGNWVR